MHAFLPYTRPRLLPDFISAHISPLCPAPVPATLSSYTGPLTERKTFTFAVAYDILWLSGSCRSKHFVSTPLWFLCHLSPLKHGFTSPTHIIVCASSSLFICFIACMPPAHRRIVTRCTASFSNPVYVDPLRTLSSLFSLAAWLFKDMTYDISSI